MVRRLFLSVCLIWCVVLFAGGATAQQVLLILDPGHGGTDQGGFYGNGFFFEGKYFPEDAYMYDVAKRVELRAKEKGWSVAFTVRDKVKAEHIADSDEYYILPPRRNLIFNLSPPYEIVHSGIDGLAKRVSVTERLHRNYAGAIQIFISLHFDTTEYYVRGVHIFTVKEARSLRFSQAIANSASAYGLNFRLRSQEYPSINTERHLFVLRRGVVAPRVLIELGNFNNRADRMLMLRSSGRDIYAEMIIDAVTRYIDSVK